MPNTKLKVSRDHWAADAADKYLLSDPGKKILTELLYSNLQKSAVIAAMIQIFYKGCAAGERKLLARGQNRGRKSKTKN